MFDSLGIEPLLYLVPSLPHNLLHPLDVRRYQQDEEEECDRLPSPDLLGPFRGLLDPVYTSA